MTQDYHAGETTKRGSVPIAHLDYGYIADCNDVKELEKILRVLRSGDEGSYPEMEHAVVLRIEKLHPNSRALRQDKPIMKLSDLDSSEREGLSEDLETWISHASEKDEVFGLGAVSKKHKAQDLLSPFEEDVNLPPVRSGTTISADGKVKEPVTTPQSAASKKKATPRSYKEWDKFDIDKELESVDNETPTSKKPDSSQPSTFKPDKIAHSVDTQGMSGTEMTAKAVREKDKGNEAFHARDFEESLVYYSRSISISPLAATYNNRALAFVRLSKWDEAINDCNSVLNLEPKNVKALLRRGTALKGKKDMAGARSDVAAVLSLEPNNKTAQDLRKDIDQLEANDVKEAAERKKSGRRMIIEEVEGEDEEEESEEIIVESPDSRITEMPVVNGHADIMTSKPPLATAAESPSSASSSAGKPPKTNKDGSSKTEAKTSKDIFSEEDTADKAPSVADDKPQLVATNIMSDQKKPAGKHQQKSNKRNKKGKNSGTGNALAEKADTASPKKSAVSIASVKAEVESGSQGVEQNGQGEAEEVCAAVHSRPLFVQKALPAVEAGLREKGNNFFRSGQYPEAISVYTTLIKKLEGAADQVVNLSLIHSNRAACYHKTGDCRSTISDCTVSLSLVPHSAKPLLRRASAYEVMEKYRQAYVDYKQVLSIDASTELAHQGASRCQGHLRTQDGLQWRDRLPPLVRVSQWDVPQIVDEANASGSGSSRTASAAQPPRVPASSSPPAAAPSPSAQGPAQQPAAVKTAPVVQEQSPQERFEETKAQGNKHVQKGEYEAAAKCYCRCVDLFSDRAAVYTNRALCYLKTNKAKDAEADCSKALELEPKNCKAFYRRALARKTQKHYKDSLQDLLQLLRLEPSNSAAKKEMEDIKGLYKQEYDQLKGQPIPEKKKPQEAEKQRKRMKIIEVEDDSDTDEKENIPQKSSASKPNLSGAGDGKPKPAPPSSQQPQSPPDNKQQTAAARAAQEATRKPGRAKSKKGGGIKETTSMGHTAATATTTPPTAPKLQGKITPYEFIQHWNTLKQAKEIQPYVQLLEQISPQDLPGVISNKLDGHMLQMISRCAAHDAQTGEVERAYSILSYIRQVPRFSTVSMFLSNKDKQDIRKVLESINSLGTHSAEEVADLRKDFGLK